MGYSKTMVWGYLEMSRMLSVQEQEHALVVFRSCRSRNAAQTGQPWLGLLEWTRVRVSVHPAGSVELHFTQSVHFLLEVKNAFVYWALTISEVPLSKTRDTMVKKMHVPSPCYFSRTPPLPRAGRYMFVGMRTRKVYREVAVRPGDVG